MKLEPLAPFLALVLTTGCGNHENDVPRCVSGAVMACPCADGSMGVQVCSMNGTSWEPCSNGSGACVGAIPRNDGGGSTEDGMTTSVDGGTPVDMSTTPGPKYVFVTSITYTGNLGGLAGADNKCSTLAASAGHAGVWVAWLSDENTDAIDRINDVGPWYGMGTDTVVAYTKPSLPT